MLGIIPYDFVDSKWLYYFLKSIDLGEYQTGTSVPALKQSTMGEIPAPFVPKDIQTSVAQFLTWFDEKEFGGSWKNAPELPYQLTKQHRILHRAEKLAARIDEARELRRLAVKETEALVSAEIYSIFSKGEDYGWVKGRLGDYVIEDCYGTSEKTTDDFSGTPVLRMGNIQNGQLNLNHLKYLNLSDKDRKRLLLIKGDILVNRTNSSELVGKCAVYELESEYAFASYLIRLRLNLQRAEPKLVAFYINSPAGRAYMFNERKQMTGQANVNAKKLKALPIALPTLPDQRRILAHLDDLQAKTDALRCLQNETAAKLDALVLSILDRAFRGEL